MSKKHKKNKAKKAKKKLTRMQILARTPPLGPPITNDFQVQTMRFNEHRYITFNYHPLLAKEEARELGLWLLYYAANWDSRPVMKEEFKILTAFKKWMIDQMERGEVY